MQPYERYEWTRLAPIRSQIANHKTFMKSEVMDDFQKSQEQEGATAKSKYVWAYVMRPVRKTGDTQPS